MGQTRIMTIGEMLQQLADNLEHEEKELQKKAWAARKAFADLAVGLDRGPSYESAAETLGGIARALRKI